LAEDFVLREAGAFDYVDADLRFSTTWRVSRQVDPHRFTSHRQDKVLAKRRTPQRGRLFCQKKAEDFVLALDKVEADDIVEYRGLLLHNVDGVPADICFNRQATEDNRNAEWWM
jgi:hypothetical protein